MRIRYHAHLQPYFQSHTPNDQVIPQSRLLYSPTSDRRTPTQKYESVTFFHHVSVRICLEGSGTIEASAKHQVHKTMISKTDKRLLISQKNTINRVDSSQYYLNKFQVRAENRDIIHQIIQQRHSCSGRARMLRDSASAKRPYPDLGTCKPGPRPT